MDKARHLPCQPALRHPGNPWLSAAMAGLFLALTWMVPPVHLARAGEPGSSPPLPPWQQDLATLELLKVTTALAPDRRNAQGETLAEHLEKAFGELGTRYPAQPEVQKACGDFYFAAGSTDRAFEYWLRAQKLAPRDAELASAMGGGYLKVGNTRAAAGQFRRAVDLRPDEPRFHTDLGTVLHVFRHDLVAPPAVPDAEASLRGALEEYRLAAQLVPANRQLAQTYAETFYILAKPDWPGALTAWQNVLALSGEDTDFANSHLARVSLRLKRPQEARTYLNRLRRPEFKDVQAKLGAQATKMEIAGTK